SYLGTDVPAGASMVLDNEEPGLWGGYSQLNVPADRTNAGTITLREADAGAVTLAVGNGATLTNTGTMAIAQGDARLYGHIVNAPGATIDVATSSSSNGELGNR